MEIRIDTSKDSPQDIKKAIEFLSKFVDSQIDQTPQTFDMPASVNMDSIFGDDKPKTSHKDEDYKIIPY